LHTVCEQNAENYTIFHSKKSLKCRELSEKEEGAIEKASKCLVRIERKAYRNIEMTFEYHSIIGYL
jgi:hypothetical protein